MHPPAVQQPYEATFVDHIQYAEKIPRSILRQDNGSKDSQKIETGAGRHSRCRTPNTKRPP